MKILEKILFITLFGALGLLSTWLQFGIIEQEQVVFDGQQRHDPDYYVENFTAIGMDENGQRSPTGAYYIRTVYELFDRDFRVVKPVIVSW